MPALGGQQPGQAPAHSKEKLDLARLWMMMMMMMAHNQTYRGTESDLGGMRLPWDGEPAPGHTAPARHMQTIPSGWMDGVLATDRPPLPGRGRRGGRPAGRRRQRGGDHQARAG